MRKFYGLLLILAILIFGYSTCPLKSYTLENRVVLSCKDPFITEEKEYIKKRKVYMPSKAVGCFSTVVKIYFFTMKTHLVKGLFFGVLAYWSPLSKFCLFFGLIVFLLSSLASILQIVTTCYLDSRWKKFARLYAQIFRGVYRVAIVILLSVLAVEILWWVIESYFFSMETNEQSLSMACVCLGCERAELKGEFRENFSSEGLKVEENSEHYRITIGELHWVIRRDNLTNRVIFAVLIYAASPSNGNKFVTSAQELANAFGWKNHSSLRYFYRIYKRDEHLSAVLSQTARYYLSKVKYLAFGVIIKEGLNVGDEQIQAKLKEEGHHFSVDIIRESLTVVNFGSLRHSLHGNYRRRNKYDEKKVITSDNVQVEVIDNKYCIKAGDLFWEIDKEDRFKWVGLLYMLNRAKDSTGKQAAITTDLHNMVGFNLTRQFTNYKRISDIYRLFKNVGGKHENNIEFTKIMQALWVEDISQGPKEIGRRMVELGHAKSMCRTTARAHMSNIDFIDVREKLARDYKKGKYKRSTKEVIEKYQKMIEGLLQHLSKGETWSKAKINKFRAEVPQSFLPQIEAKTLPLHHSNQAWLKCFLFNLPKSLDGKTCCPQCGDFDTHLKSKVPQPTIVTDPKTLETKIINIFRFYCKNSSCSTKSFSSTENGSHITEEMRFTKSCFMLRLIMDLRAPYSSAANILGVSKSTVFDQLTILSRMALHWREILGDVRFSGTLCIDEKWVKVAKLKKTKKRPFAYLFCAVDPLTYDLLHLEVYHSNGESSMVAFLTELKTQGIYPEVIMTDLLAGYTSAIRKVYGRSVTIAKCHFHFKSRILEHIGNQFSRKKADLPEIVIELRKKIFHVVDAQSKKTICKRRDELLQEKEDYLKKEPRLEPIFKCLQSYLPDLLRVVESDRVSITTNNACECVIKHFNQRYKVMGGFESMDTARRHARLFQIVHRFTPLSQDVEDQNKRGRAPLELAGYQIRHMPIFQYLTEPLLFNVQPAKNLALLKQKTA